ncbi:MAG: DUF2283 domain-containing protein [Patescibacteria group bacterium]
MKVTYDKNIDALYLSFRSGDIERTVEVGGGFHADVDKEGRIVGIELLSASDVISKGDLSRPIQIVTV